MSRHEEEFANSFIAPPKRARYLSLLKSAKGRSKLVTGFVQCKDLDMRFAKPIPIGQPYAEAIEKLLKQKGAPEICHVMSSNSDIDKSMEPVMLKILPCLDSDEMATSRRQELDISRNVAAALGRSAEEAAAKGYYVYGAGTKVDWSRYVQAACPAKISIPADASLPALESITSPETRVQVTNETTLGAARRLVESGLKPLALNFANGIHPGGGFLSGAKAQEEVLCRSSALYQTLVGDPMYEEHLKRPRPDSTDWAIYSPDVPVFRTDDGSELGHPWLLSFITCAAPYAPAIGQPEAGDLLQRRIHRVLAIARAYGHAALVLGAWGCGAFGNDAHRTATDFRQALENEFSGAFSDIVFAITDWSPERRFLGPFRMVFVSNV